MKTVLVCSLGSFPLPLFLVVDGQHDDLDEVVTCLDVEFLVSPDSPDRELEVRLKAFMDNEALKWEEAFPYWAVEQGASVVRVGFIESD